MLAINYQMSIPILQGTVPPEAVPTYATTKPAFETTLTVGYMVSDGR